MGSEVRGHNTPEHKYRLAPIIGNLPRNFLPFSRAYNQHLLPDASIDHQIERCELRETIDKALSKLDARESRILHLHYGLDDGVDRTFNEIGSLLGIVRQRVKFLHDRALVKIRYEDNLAHRFGEGIGINLRACLEH